MLSPVAKFNHSQQSQYLLPKHNLLLERRRIQNKIGFRRNTPLQELLLFHKSQFFVVYYHTQIQGIEHICCNIGLPDTSQTRKYSPSKLPTSKSKNQAIANTMHNNAYVYHCGCGCGCGGETQAKTHKWTYLLQCWYVGHSSKLETLTWMIYQCQILHAKGLLIILQEWALTFCLLATPYVACRGAQTGHTTIILDVCREMPPFFCAASETVRDVAEHLEKHTIWSQPSYNCGYLKKSPHKRLSGAVVPACGLSTLLP